MPERPAKDDTLHQTPNISPNGDDRESELEMRIFAVGNRLLTGLSPVVSALSQNEARPNQLASRLGVDKVLTSRLLKAMRTTDPVSAIHRMPGPDPLRRLLRASERAGVSADLLEEANAAVDRFESLIRDDVGDRGTLEAIISAWIPEARREFELRRKQSAYRALSQLRGSHCNAISASVFLSPCDDGEHIDLVWLSGLHGLQRARPNASARLTTRRFAAESSARAPCTLDGRPVDSLEGLLLPEFCSHPLPDMQVESVGEVVHYSLAGTTYGPRSSVDVMFAELNRGELERYIPADSQRRRFMFAEVSTPTRTIQFDAFVHRALGGDAMPRVDVYDTAFEGVASVNDRKRDIDRLGLMESVQPLGWGISSVRSPDVTRYADAVTHVFDQVGWNPNEFHVFRCRCEYPLYGSQITLSWQSETR